MTHAAGPQPSRLSVRIERQAICIGDRFRVSFQRTLRIPDDGRTYPLPPGLGVFPISAVADYSQRVGEAIRRRGGAFIPIYQREALWLGFEAAAWKPNAVQIAVGGVNALSGQLESQDDTVRPTLSAEPQNYIVCPDQPWLDGINAGIGTVRQFVAMPLGQGYTIEAALSGREQFGGMRITVFEPRPGLFPDEPHGEPSSVATIAHAAMGVGAGGAMKQKIYADRHGIDTWDQEVFGRVVVHLINSEQFQEITGLQPPPTPVSARTYTEHGLPWFDLYDEQRLDVPPPEALANVKSIEQRDREIGRATETDESFQVPETQVRKLHPGGKGAGQNADRENP